MRTQITLELVMIPVLLLAMLILGTVTMIEVSQAKELAALVLAK